MEQLLTPAALGQLLGLKTQTVYNRRSSGGDLPPSLKLGGAVRFRPADVSSWLESRSDQNASRAARRPYTQTSR